MSPFSKSYPKFTKKTFILYRRAIQLHEKRLAIHKIRRKVRRKIRIKSRRRKSRGLNLLTEPLKLTTMIIYKIIGLGIVSLCGTTSWSMTFILL